jgi:glyceraldehyde-3-phosphate dehydrogenase/erythrose-4-phosphate dehydrogenase
MRVGINGMGRMGRLALRAAFGAVERPHDDPRTGNRLELVHLNEIRLMMRFRVLAGRSGRNWVLGCLAA